MTNRTRHFRVKSIFPRTPFLANFRQAHNIINTPCRTITAAVSCTTSAAERTGPNLWRSPATARLTQNNERREPRTLRPQHQYHRKNSCNGFRKEAHQSKNIFSRRQCALPCRVRSWPAGSTTETSARRSRRAASRYQRKTRLEPANSKLLSTTTAVFLAWCCCFLPLDRPVCGGPPQPNN